MQVRFSALASPTDFVNLLRNRKAATWKHKKVQPIVLLSITYRTGKCMSVKSVQFTVAAHIMACRSPKLCKAINLVPVTMLQASLHVIHSKRILDFGEGQLTGLQSLSVAPFAAATSSF
jgi:hypothetical protein